MTPDGPAAAPRSRRRILGFLVLAVLLLVVAGIYGTGLHRSLTFDTLVAQREALKASVEAHRALAMLAYVGAYTTAVSLSLPGAWWLSVLGGFLFGWLIGGLLAFVSAATGAVAIFLVARSSFGEVLARRAGPMVQRLARGFRRDAFSYLLFLRLVPIVPFWLVNITPAFLGVPLATYALATAIGIIPATFAFATAGDGFDSLIDAHQAAAAACLAAGGTDCARTIGMGDLVTPQILAAIAALGVISLLPVLIRRWLGRRFQEPDEGNP